LKKLFLASPAVFFVPAAALVDKASRGQIMGVLQRLVGPAQVRSGDSVEALLSNSKIKGLLDGISLNKIRVKVGGIVSVDINSVPAKLDSVTLDQPCPPWDGTHAITGVLDGALLSSGQPAIEESKQYGINIETSPDQSTGNQLRFTLNLSQAVPAGMVLHFHVIKTKENKMVDSNQVQVSVPGLVK
jgi:hypothetical protein